MKDREQREYRKQVAYLSLCSLSIRAIVEWWSVAMRGHDIMKEQWCTRLVLLTYSHIYLRLFDPCVIPSQINPL